VHEHARAGRVRRVEEAQASAKAPGRFGTTFASAVMPLAASAAPTGAA
jgi:hypothetical protein